MVSSSTTIILVGRYIQAWVGSWFLDYPVIRTENYYHVYIYIYIYDIHDDVQ